MLHGEPLMPFAAKTTDLHTCPMVTAVVPHVGGPTLSCAATVLINNLPAARIGDMAVCTGPPDSIIMGNPTVLIANKPAARMGDSTAHGGVVAVGSVNVIIS